MLETLINLNESKTLEFKQNAKSLLPIVKAVVAFANTSGGYIIIGVDNKRKTVIGVENPLLEEERLASVIADSIAPLIIPDIQILSFRNKELLVIQVPHLAGPFYLKSAGIERGVYIRLGSTNRLADKETILSLQMLAKNISFDELPCHGAALNDIDNDVFDTNISPHLGKLSNKHYESLGVVVRQHNKLCPTNGGILLFGKDRFKWFPDSSIMCVCFASETQEEIIDQQEITTPLIQVHEAILAFIKRNTATGAKIQEIKREDIPQYPPQAIREAVINAIVHADYSQKGSHTRIAIFPNRIEITNPGGLTYGQTMEMALSGISRMRNRLIGRIFREVKLIERLGTGIKRMLSVYSKINAKQPHFEELNTHFRTILYATAIVPTILTPWEKSLLRELEMEKKLGTTAIAKLWQVSTRTARSRLAKMVDLGLIIRVATSPKDPYAVFKLNQ